MFRRTILAIALSLAIVSTASAQTLRWTDIVTPAGSFNDDGADFNILSELVRFAQLDGTITTLRGFTLFAPNDNAFRRLSRNVGGFKNGTEKEVLDALVGVVTAGVMVDGEKVAGVDLVKAILLYHVVEFPVGSGVVLGHAARIPTMSKKFIISPGTGELVDMSVDIPNAKVIKADVMVENGVTVHVINQVLIPVNIPVDIDTLVC